MFKFENPWCRPYLYNHHTHPRICKDAGKNLCPWYEVSRASSFSPRWLHSLSTLFLPLILELYMLSPVHSLYFPHLPHSCLFSGFIHPHSVEAYAFFQFQPNTVCSVLCSPVTLLGKHLFLHVLSFGHTVLKQWFSLEPTLLLRVHLAMSGKSFDCHSCRWWCPRHPVGRSQGCWYLITHLTSPLHP